VWFKINNLTYPQIIVSKRYYAGGNERSWEFGLIYDPRLAARVSLDGTDLGGREVTYVIEPNVWYHACFTHDGSKLKLYVNGILVNTVDAIGNIYLNNINVEIGKVAGLPTGYFNGIIDEVLIYNRALSEEEIKKLYYNSLENKFNITIGLLNNGYADLGNSFTAIIYLKNGTILQLPINFDNQLKKGNYVEYNLTVNGYYPSYGLVDKLIVCSNDCQGVCSEVIVNNKC